MTRESMTNKELDDHEIEHMIVDALSQDRRVPLEKIAVGVEGGDITLSGRVDCIGEKDAAEEDARRIPGVGQIINDIAIQPDQPADDMDTAGKVMERLTADARIPAGHFDVVSNNGIITLRGEAVTEIQKRAALDDANLVYGVRQVIDEIIVMPQQTASDHLLEEQVMQELSRAPFLDEGRIFVYVRDSVAYISGTVDFPQQVEIAEQTARDVPGLTAVVSEVTVQQSA